MIRCIEEELVKLSQQIQIAISVSIGSAVYPDEAETLDRLLHVADQDMYAAKSNKYLSNDEI